MQRFDLKAFRETNNLKQDAIAQLVGVTRSGVSRAETGLTDSFDKAIHGKSISDSDF